jgi:hypothetical protein
MTYRITVENNLIPVVCVAQGCKCTALINVSAYVGISPTISGAVPINWSVDDRLDKAALVPLMNEVYSTLWCPLQNHFCSSLKLNQKQRDGAKAVKQYHASQTPYQKDVGTLISPVWDKPAGSINGKTVSLDDIENKILRQMGEPRIHFAIVCASVSCPDLRNTPYTASNLNAQMNEQVQQFLANADKRVRIGDRNIQISRIFDWFEMDSKPAGGVETFIRRYRADLPELPLKDGINYDWSLNGITETQ